MPTKTDLVKAKLAKNPAPDPETMREWAKEIGCSLSLVYKWLRRMPAEARQVVSASEPVVIVEEGSEEIIEEPEDEEAFEVPSFEEKPEVTEKEEPEEIEIGEGGLEEEEKRLRDIAGRAISRIFDVLFSELLDLTKVGLSKQESDDTNFLTMLMVAKYLKVEIREYLLEFTAGLHFGSLGLKVLVAWLKKRAEEKEKEKPVNLPEPEPEPTATPEVPVESTERVPLCVACGKQPIAEGSKEGLCVACQKKAKKKYVKKVTGGNF